MKSKFDSCHTVQQFVSLLSSAFLLLVVFTSTGCTRRRFEPTLDARFIERKISENRADMEDVLELRAMVDNPLEAHVTSIEVVGLKASQAASNAIVAADALPAGKGTLRVRVLGEVRYFGKRWKPVEKTVETSVTRPTLAPRAHIVSYASGGCALTSDRLCMACPSPMRDEAITTFVASGPKGTKVELLGKSITTSGQTDSTSKVGVSLIPLVLTTNLDGAVRVDARITSGDGIVSTTSCAIRPDSLVTWATLSRVRSGPVLFAGEDATPGKPKVAAVLARQMVSTLGRGTLRDLEIVADVDPLPVRRRECGVYTGQSTGKRIAISNVAEDADVTVYARKTGKVVAKRRFSAAMPACPTSISAKFTGLSGEVDRKSVDAFVTSFLVK